MLHLGVLPGPGGTTWSFLVFGAQLTTIGKGRSRVQRDGGPGGTNCFTLHLEIERLQGNREETYASLALLRMVPDPRGSDQSIQTTGHEDPHLGSNG